MLHWVMRESPERPPVEVTLRFFALLREQRGLSEERVRTQATSARGLYDELAARHGFSLPGDRVGVAINGAFAALDAELQAGDTVVFIPPIAGG